MSQAALRPQGGPAVRSLIASGLGVMAVFFGGFGSWAALAPLESAAIAPGQVVVEDNRKTVQHLEGGIVSDILVQEGAKVEAGAPLIVLSGIQSKAEWEVLNIRETTGLAEKARLEAERDGRESISFPPELMDDTAELETLRAGQESVFRAHKEVLASQTDILNQRIAQLHEEMEGHQQEIAAQRRQLQLIESEIRDVSGLVRKQLMPRPRLTALQRAQAEIQGGIAGNKAAIARAQQQIGETRFQIENVRVSFLKEVTERLREVERDLLSTQERLKASGDVLKRQVIRAPVSGTVVNLTVFTVGGVIQPGQPIMEIVPANASVLIEARVQPSDIDEVHAGQTARVRLSAFSRRTVPMLGGQVLTVSPDALRDQRTGAAYYEARILLDPDAIHMLRGESIVPGMPAEVMIVTGTRTTLEYLVEPLTRSIEWGMRES